jgi:hypothetical protein
MVFGCGRAVLFNFPLSVQFVFLYLISFISYICIEKPFRAGPVSQPKKCNLRIYHSFVQGGIIYVRNFKKNCRKGLFSPPTEENFQSCQYNNIDDDKCLLRSKQKNQIFFIGDSHSQALLPLMVKLNEKPGYQVCSIRFGGLYTTKLTSSNHGDIGERGAKVLEFLERKRKRGDVVVLTNQLMTWFFSTYNDKQEDHRLFLDGKQLAQDQALKNYSVEIDQLAKILDGMGMSLLVIVPFPEFKFHPNTCYSPILTKYFKDIKVSKKM